MYKKIEELLKRFYDEYGRVQRCLYDDENEKEIYVEKELVRLFLQNGFDKDGYDFDIAHENVFSCPSADMGCLSIAYVDSEGLTHLTYTTI